MGEVTLKAKELLTEAVRLSGRKSSVQFPGGFARIADPGDTETPLSRMFVQGEVALKTYLTLVMLTRKAPHELHKPRPDHYWSVLLGYEEFDETDPTPGAGTRRVKRAMKALSDTASPTGQGWIKRTIAPGYGYQITVAHMEVSRAPYISVPIQLWSRGWLNVMSARALFVYLCLRLLLVGKKEDEGVQVSAWDRKLFAMSEDTLLRGMKELEALGLARSEANLVSTDLFSSDLRKRKLHYLNTDYLIATDSPRFPVELGSAKPDVVAVEVETAPDQVEGAPTTE
jgi:hypothetical protein